MNKNVTLRGYHIKGRKGLDHWDALMEEWLLCTERYCRVAAGEDAPFIYTERANIGLLAAAAWRCGRVALEEFQYQKGYRNKKKWNGRADLYLASENTEEMIEAKFGWLSLSSPEAAPEKAAAILASAERDAKQTKGSQSDLKCLGIAFLPTWVTVSKSEELEQQIDQTVGALASSNFHALAWCFPKEYRRIENSVGQYTPGVVMIVSNPAYVSNCVASQQEDSSECDA